MNMLSTSDHLIHIVVTESALDSFFCQEDTCSNKYPSHFMPSCLVVVPKHTIHANERESQTYLVVLQCLYKFLGGLR